MVNPMRQLHKPPRTKGDPRNPLHRYMVSRQMSAAEFSVALAKVRGHAVSESQISRWRCGDVVPGAAGQWAIEKVTRGAVTPSQWLGYAKAIKYIPKNRRRR